jgi:hypothetical protein
LNVWGGVPRLISELRMERSTTKLPGKGVPCGDLLVLSVEEVGEGHAVSFPAKLFDRLDLELAFLIGASRGVAVSETAKVLLLERDGLLRKMEDGRVVRRSGKLVELQPVRGASAKTRAVRTLKTAHLCTAASTVTAPKRAAPAMNVVGFILRVCSEDSRSRWAPGSVRDVEVR